MSATSFAQWRNQVFSLAQRDSWPDALALALQPPAGLSSGERAMGAFWAACLYCQQGETAAALDQLQAVHARGDWLAPARLAEAGA